MVLELGDAFEDGDVRIFGKVGGRRRAGCDGEKVDAGVLGGFGVDVAVAGVEDVGLFDAEVLDGAQQACGLWLMARDIVAADNEVDEFGHVVDVEFSCMRRCVLLEMMPIFAPVSLMARSAATAPGKNVVPGVM